jgi:hypothetical protein
MERLFRAAPIIAAAAGTPDMAFGAEPKEMTETTSAALAAMETNYIQLTTQLRERGATIVSADDAGMQALLRKMSEKIKTNKLFFALDQPTSTTASGRFQFEDITCEANIVRIVSDPNSANEVKPFGSPATPTTVFNTGIASELLLHCTDKANHALDIARIVYFTGSSLSKIESAGIDVGQTDLFTSVGRSFLASPETASHTTPEDLSLLGRWILLEQGYAAVLGNDSNHLSGEVYGIGQTLEAGIQHFANQGAPLNTERLQSYIIEPR